MSSMSICAQLSAAKKVRFGSPGDCPMIAPRDTSVDNGAVSVVAELAVALGELVGEGSLQAVERRVSPRQVWERAEELGAMAAA